MITRVAVKLLGRRAVHKAIQNQTRRRGLNFRLGLTLLRDRSVPGRFKLKAFVVALLAMLFLNILEIPIETFLALAMPIIGVPFDIAWNGFENVVGPLVLTIFALPFVVPRELVDRIQQLATGTAITELATQNTPPTLTLPPSH